MKASLPGSDVLLTLSHVSPGSGHGDERGRTMARAGVNTQPQDPEEYKQHPPACLDAIKPLPGMEKDLRTDENYREESIDKATSEDRRMAWGELTTYGLMSY